MAGANFFLENFSLFYISCQNNAIRRTIIWIWNVWGWKVHVWKVRGWSLANIFLKTLIVDYLYISREIENLRSLISRFLRVEKCGLLRFSRFFCINHQDVSQVGMSMLKFMFSKKATKIDEIFTVDLTTYTANVYRQTTDKLMFKSVISTIRWIRK